MWEWLKFKKRFSVRVRTYGYGGAYTAEWSYGRYISWNKFLEAGNSHVTEYFRVDYQTVVDFAKQFKNYEDVKQYIDRIEEKYPRRDKIIIDEQI